MSDVTKIAAAIISPSSEIRAELRTQVNASGLAAVVFELDHYCAPRDEQFGRLVPMQPDVVIIDMEDPQAAISTLQTVHARLPGSWLFVSSEMEDPQLIIEAMRAGAREFLPRPFSSTGFIQAFRRYLEEKEKRIQSGSLGEIYGVTSAKGGTGVTCVAVNLAASIAQLEGTRVALVDLNSPVGDAAAYLNLKPKFTVSEALESASRLDGVLLENYMSRKEKLAVLAGFRDFQPRSSTDISALHRLLEVVNQTFSHTIIDVPSSINPDWLQLVMEASAQMIVVLTPELPALWRTIQLLEFAEQRGVADKPKLVINRSQKSDRITHQEIEETLSRRVYWALPNHYADCIESINSGIPLVSTNNSGLAGSFFQLAHKITGIRPADKSGRFIRLFSRKGV